MLYQPLKGSMAARFIRGSENGDDAENVCLLNILSFSSSYLFFFQNKVFFKPRNVIADKMAASTCNATLLHYKSWRDVARITNCSCNLLSNIFRVAICGKMLRRVEVTSTCCNVLRQLATWKCVARQVAFYIFCILPKTLVHHTKVYERIFFYFMDGLNDLFCRLVVNYPQVLLKLFRTKRLSWRCSANSPGKPSNGIRRNFYANDLTFRNRTLRQKRSA